VSAKEAAAPIHVIGITDRGVDSLCAEARALVERAELLCGGERHLAFFPDHSAERFVIKANIGALVQRLGAEQRPAVVLASGDPALFGIGPILADRLGPQRVCILPNLSSVQLAFARLGEAWQDAAVLSAHGRPLRSIFPSALLARKAAILTDEHNTPAAIAQALLGAGNAGTMVDVFEHLDGPEERHTSGTLEHIAEQTFAPLNLLVLRRAGNPRPWPLGLPEDAYLHARGLITKAEVRAVSLARLRLHERSVVWDVGAGSGSVSIEAAALAHHGQVFAVERDPTQHDYLRENLRRFAAGNVCLVEGEAPEALRELPDPDAVFVGGSGGQLAAIVEAASGRLIPGGHLVANLATLEHVAELLSLARSLAWPVDVTEVNIARSTGVGDLTRLAAQNPVFVVTLEKPR
jgi:precorrin-6B C5,15-methyltransferase / cobalt-precorrin-6B C5,C15-methyltransferase